MPSDLLFSSNMCVLHVFAICANSVMLDICVFKYCMVYKICGPRVLTRTPLPFFVFIPHFFLFYSLLPVHEIVSVHGMAVSMFHDFHQFLALVNTCVVFIYDDV